MEELSLNVLDVAENSVRAGATLIEIEIAEARAEETLTIIIKDNGCGMDEKQVASVINPFYTTRTTRKVGLGVPFFKMAAEMTGGSFLINSKPGEGTNVKAVFGLNHIDRMPLGDINSTIITLIQCNPEIDFIYRYKIDENSFVADTRQIKEILEGVPLSEPRVLNFIRGYLTENTGLLKEKALK